MPDEKFHKNDFEVRAISVSDARDFISRYHYARGGSNTGVYLHGLFKKGESMLIGVAWWLPPTRVACESVNKEQWTKVLSLTRMAIKPGTPKNACSFLLSKSVKIIRSDRRFTTLVTYADESQGHTGLVYRASGWSYLGRTGPYPRWLNKDGVQVAPKSTKNRTKQQMLDLGCSLEGRYYKHKYVLYLR